MSTMIDFWGNLGATAGQGAGNFLEGRRFLEERDRLRKQQDEALRRQTSLQNLQFHQDEAQAARASGNLAGAADLYRKMLEDRNAFDGGERVGVKFIGTYGTKEGERPTAGFVGPMPGVQTYDANTPDWKNQKNLDLLDAGIGYQPPKPNLIETSPGATLYNPVTRQAEFTAPYPENPYKLTADTQEELRRLGITTGIQKTQMGIDAAGARQDKSIQASTDRQTRSLQAADTKTFGTIVNTLAADFPGIQVTSGQRSHAEQQRLWDEDLKANGGKPSGRVARPGHSAHETGLARDVYVPPAQREAFIAAAQAQGLYVKADYPDGHIHIAVPQGVRPAAPVKPKLITQYQDDGTGKRVRDGEGVSTGKRPTAPKTLKPWDSSLATAAWREAEKKFPDKVKGFTDPETQKKRQAHVDDARNQYEAARRKASGEQSPLGRVVELMEAEARERGAKQPF